ncbi:protein spire homolog 1-like isoform X2 [Antedon mediterranea]|uniref:protein spire homolog 1-like isoform X2 n=1 Tax=Antedon mediterranea TaxID=105859 RepID=UPI003AF85452
MAEGPPIKLDIQKDGYANLDGILESFGAPLNEEQAWALCYQCAKYLHEERRKKRTQAFDFQAISIYRDGSIRIANKRPVHTQNNGSSTESSSQTEIEVVNALGLTVYQALDYGCAEDEERELSGPLESLIDHMTNAAEDDNTDEGIDDSHDFDEKLDSYEFACGGGASGEGSKVPSLLYVLRVCTNRVSSTKASGHYQAVCRAVLAEIEELTTFLEVLSKGTKNIKKFSVDTDTEGERELEDIKPREWARLWLQLMHTLRQGVKLKKVAQLKVDNVDMLYEYELTPYEILMDDIRSRRYNLRKVMINGDIPPRVRKEAHDVILDFIRSRPPLRPAKERILNSTPPKLSSLHDQLLKGIRSNPQLKPVTCRILGPKLSPPGSKSSARSDRMSDSESEVEPLNKNKTKVSTPSELKKILSADIELNWSDEETEVEMTDNEFKSKVMTNGVSRVKLVPPPTPPTPEPQKGFFQRTEERLSLKLPKKLGFFDLSFLTGDKEEKPVVEPKVNKSTFEATEEFSDYDSDREERLQRRHSINLCRTSRYSTSLVPPMVNTSTPNSEWVLINKPNPPPRRARKKRRSNVKFSDSDSLKEEDEKRLEMLSLTIDEVTHIRSVLVRAEVENLRGNQQLYDDIRNEKVCFSCKKKFALFKRKFRCNLCKRLTCGRCMTKMLLPRESFLQIAVDKLSPGNMKMGLKRARSFTLPKSQSQPSSPIFQKKFSKKDRRDQRYQESEEDVCCECCDLLQEAVKTGIQPNPISDKARGFSVSLPVRVRLEGRKDSLI